MQLANFAATHTSAKYVATVAETTSWCRLWDLALDCGVQGTWNAISPKELSRDQYQVMGLVIPPKLILTDLMYTLTVMFIAVSLAVVSSLGTNQLRRT